MPDSRKLTDFSDKNNKIVADKMRLRGVFVAECVPEPGNFAPRSAFPVRQAACLWPEGTALREGYLPPVQFAASCITGPKARQLAAVKAGVWMLAL